MNMTQEGIFVRAWARRHGRFSFVRKGLAGTGRQFGNFIDFI
jgi:hypothetical protein